MREPWEIEADKQHLDLIFYIYQTYLESACRLEGKPLTDLDYHLNHLGEFKDKLKRLIKE